MLTFAITWQRYNGRQSKNLYIKSKIWQKGNDQFWNNIYIYMVDRGTAIQETSEIYCQHIAIFSHKHSNLDIGR